jgi:hypothetical protein
MRDTKEGKIKVTDRVHRYITGLICIHVTKNVYQEVKLSLFQLGKSKILIHVIHIQEISDH